MTNLRMRIVHARDWRRPVGPRVPTTATLTPTYCDVCGHDLVQRTRDQVTLIRGAL